MCGITGALSLNRSTINVDFIKSMADVISHRGPDDAGYLCFHTGARSNPAVSFYHNLTDNKYRDIEDMLPR